MKVVTIYAGGQIMLPSEIRRKLNIKEGDSLAFFLNEERIYENENKEIIMCKTSTIQNVLNAHTREYMHSKQS